MNTRNILRGVLILAIVAASGLLATAWRESPESLAVAAEAQSELPFEDRSSIVPPRENTTVITTDPPGRSNETAEIVALAPDGRVLYYNDTYRNYFDVDPSPAGRWSVLYVAGTRYDPCPSELEAEARIDVGNNCAMIAVERANLSTGETTRIHTEVTEWGIWHDVDRLDESHLVVGDIEADRVLVLDTTSGTTEWVWEAKSEFDPSSGGFPDDWTHINDVEVLDDGRIVASLRNMDQVIFLDPGEGMDENWTLGSENQYDVLYEQHNPDYIPRERGGPAIIVSDSENNRVVEYQRTGTDWERSWEWRDDRLRWPRDADRLPNGNTLVTDSQGNRVIEVTRRGRVVWNVTIGTPYEAERLETGDESSTGRSAVALGHSSIDENRTSSTGEASSRPGPVSRAIAFIAGPVVNGILYATPAWMTIDDLPALGLLAGTVLVWIVLELRWSSLGWPLRRNR